MFYIPFIIFTIVFAMAGIITGLFLLKLYNQKKSLVFIIVLGGILLGLFSMLYIGGSYLLVLGWWA